jgi:chemotaxis protein methyltransferase CheR
LFDEIRKLATAKLGIHLGDHKNALIENRMVRLKSKLNFNKSLEELLEELKEGRFTKEFVSAFTTNQTGFFREAAQFEYFLNDFLPSCAKSQAQISVLCAGCSSGEEAYTMAICYDVFKKSHREAPLLKITAVDIDEERLKAAKDGIYALPHKNPFPDFVKESFYFDTIEENGTKKMRVKESLKEFVSFEKHNLADQKEGFKNSFFDAVFCRNTLIYFDKPTQEAILKKLLLSLKHGGMLYLGHSENPLSHIDKLQKKGRNIYIKKLRD